MFRAAVVLCLISLVVVGAYAEDEDRIVGGKSSLINKCPCAVSLQLREVHKCGGSILNDRFVLTAAHCIKVLEKSPLEDITIRAGCTMWSVGGQYMGVKKMSKHPKYDPITKQYDFAMVKLDKCLSFDVTVRPCTLATKIPANGRNALICGWGLKKEDDEMPPNMFQTANVTIISKMRCGSEEFGYGDDIMDTMMCASNPNVDACQGDSGGPIITGNELSGVTSFGRGCGLEKYPGVYGSVASVLKWIERQIETM